MKTVKKRQQEQHYAPWDREAFLCRLKTFSISRWTVGYVGIGSISQVQWAKRGWRCVGVNTVECVLCLSQIVVKLQQTQEEEDDDDDEAARKIAGIYARLIIEGHSGSCLWRIHGCEDSIYRVVFSNERTAREEFESRVESFTGEEHVDLGGLSLEETRMVDHITTTSTPTKVILALTGWRKESGVIGCDMCFRRVMEVEDVFGDHMEYCPWINATTQGRNEPGWRILANLLLQEGGNKRRDIDDDDDDVITRQRSTLERLGHKRIKEQHTL